MNTTFSLDRRVEKVFPTVIRHKGNTFFVNADFRNILRILRMNDDPEVLEILKPNYLAKWFFQDSLPESTDDAIEIFRFFLSGKDEDETRVSEPQFDFEFDAEEIYASFLKEYSIDLFEVPYMHWKKFIILLSNLSDDSPFRQKVRLRFMDVSGYKGKELLKVMEAKEAVQIPVKYTKEELDEMKAFEAEWG